MADNKNDNNSGRGFAGMDEQRQREIASQGGRASHESGKAHEFTPEEAREAGRKGGEARGNQNRENTGNAQGSPRGGTREQQQDAGRQSHKNDK